MNREHVIAILKVLKTSYPRFYADMSKQEAEDTISLWTEMFANEDPRLITIAVKNLINTSKFPPTIADIKEEAYKLIEDENNKETPIELWNRIVKAISNSIYNSGAEFEKLPEPCKKFVGTPRQLMEWAMSTDFNDGVLRGQFLKQLEIIQQREKDEKMMLPGSREAIKQLTESTFLLEN